MSQRLSIGLLLPTLPGYSETFIYSKINGLLESGYIVSLFINHYNKYDVFDIDIPVYSQANVSKKYLFPIILFVLIIMHPIIVFNFVRQERISNKSWSTILKHIIINSHILNKKLDWIHFEFATMGIDRENVAKAMGIKSTVSFRGFDIGLYPHQHQGCYNLLWKTIVKVHTISDALYQQAIDLGLNPIIPVKKITPAIDTNFFLSKKISELHNPIRILSVGRLTWIKGFEYALKALNLLQYKNIDFVYSIVGEGDYREAITYAIHQHGLSDKVKLKGKLSHKEVKEEMEWADIYIQPSIQEGFCNAVLEAQAMGLPCIVSNAEGLPENVINNKSGWVVNKRSSQQIADKINEVLSMNKKELNQIRKYARRRVIQHYSIEHQKDSFNWFYKL